MTTVKDGNELPKNQPVDNQSKKQVGGVVNPVKDPDATSYGANETVLEKAKREAAEKADAVKASQDSSAIAAAKGTEADNKAEATEPTKVMNEIDAAQRQADIGGGNSEFERARLENDNVITAEEQARIDASMGDHSEYDEEEAVEAAKERDPHALDRLQGFSASYKSVREVITNLVRDVPADTPDEHIVWGASGHVLRMGHLRQLVMGVQD